MRRGVGGFVRGGLCRQKRINTGAPVCWSGQQNRGRKAGREGLQKGGEVKDERYCCTICAFS